MRKIITIVLLTLSTNLIFGQNYYMPKPEGYGAAATGGGDATPVTVSTYTALVTQLKSTAPSVILVSGTIDCDYTSLLLTNKTIIGLPGARLRNLKITVGNPSQSAANSGILYIKPGSKNVIIRNLIFEGPGAYDADARDNLTNEGTDIWVDHCEFQDGMDGNFDNKGKADDITISWCKFTYLKPAIAGGSGGSDDHRFTNLIGSSITDFPTDGQYSITFQNNYFAEGCKARMPRARNAQLHVLNCYYKTSVKGSSAIGLGAGNNGTTCYVENSNFEEVTNVSNPTKEGTSTTSVKFVGSIKLATGVAVNNLDVGEAAKPTYNYTVMPVADVAKYVGNTTCGAGATLQVSSTGVISTSCLPLASTETTLKLGLKYYPTVVENVLNIDIPRNISGKGDITIFSTTGQKAFSYSKKADSGENIKLNLEKLVKGVYFCNIQFNDKTTSFKFIKR